MKLPWRSFLNTARYAHPWLWKSPNWTFDRCGLSELSSVVNSGSCRLPRAADSFGLRIIDWSSCSAVGFRCFAGYMNFASDSSSYHMYPM